MTARTFSIVSCRFLFVSRAVEPLAWTLHSIYWDKLALRHYIQGADQRLKIESKSLIHSLDHESGSVSPRAHKKRRTDVEAVESEGHPSTIIQPGDATADNQIEEELTLALTAAAEEERKDRIANGGQAVVDESFDIGATSDVQVSPEIVSVVSNIMGHSERLKEQYTQDQQANETNTSPRAFTFIKASTHLKTQSLPILENLVRVSP